MYKIYSMHYAVCTEVARIVEIILYLLRKHDVSAVFTVIYEYNNRSPSIFDSSYIL